MSASVLSVRPPQHHHHDLGGPSIPTRAAPPPPANMPHSKSRELARALEEERAGLSVRAFRPPSAWGETDGEADVVWGGENGYVPPQPLGAGAGLLPSPGVSSAVSGEGDRFSDAASWDDESAVDVASPRQLSRGTGRQYLEEEEEAGNSDGPDFLAGLSGNMEDETLGEDMYNESRSTYGHARVSSVASSVWAGRGAPNAGLGGARKAPPPPLPDMALRAQNMAVPLASPASVYSPGADGFGGRMPQWQSAGLPDHESSANGDDELARLTADRDAGDTSGVFEMMNTRQSSSAPSRAPSSGAHGAQYERGVSPDGLDSSADAPTTAHADNGFPDAEEDEADDVAPLGRAPSASSRKASSSASSPQPNAHMMPPPPTTMPPARPKGRRNRSPVLSYDGGAEAEERLVALQAGPGDLQRMSSLGPRLKKNSPAPWELGDDEPADDTASIAAGRRPSATSSSDLAPPSRGFTSGWGRQSGEGGRPRPSPRSTNQALPSVDPRASLASRADQQQRLDVESELAEYEAAAAAAAAANATSKRARSKSVSSQAAGMLKGLGLAASAAPANKKTGKFAKAFRRDKAPSVPSSSAATSLAGSHGSEDYRKGPTNLSAGISSDDYAHYASASSTGRAASPQHALPAPPSPLSFASASSPSLAAVANARPLPGTHLVSGGSSPAVPRSPSASSASPLPPSAASAAAAAAIGPGRQSSSTTESHGNTSTSATSARSSGHTAATSPGVGPYAVRSSESTEQHLHAGSSAGTGTAPLNLRKQEHSPNATGLGFQPVSTGGLRSPAPLSTPRMSPASPGRVLPNSNTQPRLASVGYKRSSTFLADGVPGVARSPSGGGASPSGSGLGAQAGFTFPPARSPQISRSPSARSQDDRIAAAAAAEQDTRAESATPTAGKALNVVQPSLSSDGSIRSSPMPSPSGGAPQQLMPFAGQLHPSASSGDVSTSSQQMVPSGSVVGMSTMPSVGSHEGVPYKLISLEQARKNQERERVSSRPTKEGTAHASTDYSRQAGVGAPPGSPDDARRLKNKKSGFMRMFGKEKNGSEHLSGDAWEGHQPGSLPSASSHSSSLDVMARKSPAQHMPSLAVNGDGAAAVTDENKGMAPALSLRPVSSMFAGFMPEMLDPASFDDKAKAAAASPVSPTASSDDLSPRHLLPHSPAVTARSSSSAESNISRVDDMGGSKAHGSGKAASRIASARSAHTPAAIAPTSHSAMQQTRSGSMRGSLKGSDVGSPGFQSASSHMDEGAADEAFHSPSTSPTNGTFGAVASADASRQSFGKHGTQLRGQDSLRAPPHSRALPGSLPRPHSTASTHSDASSALGLVAGFPATPEISPATTPQLPAAVRTRAMAIETAIAELAAELTALRNSAEADGLLPASPQPTAAGSAIPSCASCGCNCAEQRRVQAVNEAAVLKGVSILNRTRALKPSANGDVCSFGGYRDR